MVNTWQPIFAALVIFAAGVVTGGLTVKMSSKKESKKPERHRVVNVEQPSLYPGGSMGSGPNLNPGPYGRPGAAQAGMQNPSGGRERRTDAQMQNLIRRIHEELSLRPEQSQRVEAIVKESQQQMKRLWDQFPAEFQAMRQKIRAELNPEQRKRFEEIFRQKNEWQNRQPFPRMMDGPQGPNPQNRRPQEGFRPGESGPDNPTPPL